MNFLVPRLGIYIGNLVRLLHRDYSYFVCSNKKIYGFQRFFYDTAGLKPKEIFALQIIRDGNNGCCFYLRLRETVKAS